MIDKNELIKALHEECEKDIYKELPAWVLKVIEKQLDWKEVSDGRNTPKKPLEIYTTHFDVYTFGTCPTCGEGCNDGMNYCDKCGQKLSWKSEQ